MNEVIAQETLRLAKGAVILDLVCLLISGGLGYSLKSMALGLLFGTLFELLHFQLIGLSVKRSLSNPSPAAARRGMTAGVLARYILSGVIIWVGIRSPSLNVFGVVLPLFYPKMIYYAGAVYGQLRKRKEEKTQGGRT